jgi:chaperonin cofactor prefoldin
MADTTETMNRQYAGISEEVTELRNVIQVLTEKTNEVLEQNVKSEMAETAESLNRQYADLYEQMMIQQRQIDELKKFLTWNP